MDLLLDACVYKICWENVMKTVMQQNERRPMNENGSVQTETKLCECKVQTATGITPKK